MYRLLIDAFRFISCLRFSFLEIFFNFRLCCSFSRKQLARKGCRRAEPADNDPQASNCCDVHEA
jgi:hypothetical protein